MRVHAVAQYVRSVAASDVIVVLPHPEYFRSHILAEESDLRAVGKKSAKSLL